MRPHLLRKLTLHSFLFRLLSSFILPHLKLTLASPMILSHTNENPYPTIGGTAPPVPDKKPQLRDPRVAKYGVSQSYSGHGGAPGSTPYDRVTAIIEREEEREAKKKREEFERQFKADELVV